MIRIAMWSGPRNISTALMRAWGARADTVVVDEPLYACWLHRTGADHPGRAEILDRHETDWRRVAAALREPLPAGRSIRYEKHMAHHLLPEIDRDWLKDARHALLIRDPREMLASLARVVPDPALEDTGLPQQLELRDWLTGLDGRAPPILDARDTLEDPAAMLRALCDALDVPFDPAMLSWPAGPRATDGVWARHWYGAVEASTGFQPYRPPDGALPAGLTPLHERCAPLYQALHRDRLRPRPAARRDA